MHFSHLVIAACVLPQTAALVGIRPSPVHRNARLAATAVAAGKSDDDAKIKAAPRASKAQWSQLANLVRKDWPLLGAASVALAAAALADVAVPHFSSGALTAVVAKDAARVRAQLWGLSIASLLSATFTGVRGGL